MVKEKNISKLKKDLWEPFSKFIRIRDQGVCITCGKVIPDYYDRHGNLLPGWKSAHAGHFITAKNCGIKLYFHEQNVHAQCYHCNINLSGNWVEYEKAIIKKYGKEKCEELKQMKYENNKWTRADYEEKINYYKTKLKEFYGV